MYLGIRWMFADGPRIALDSTQCVHCSAVCVTTPQLMTSPITSSYASLVCVEELDTSSLKTIRPKDAAGQASHTAWSLSGRTYEVMAKWERPAKDRGALGE